MTRKYHNHKPQKKPWHREEEPNNHHETPGRQTKESNQLSLLKILSENISAPAYVFAIINHIKALSNFMFPS